MEEINRAFSQQPLWVELGREQVFPAARWLNSADIKSKFLSVLYPQQIYCQQSPLLDKELLWEREREKWTASSWINFITPGARPNLTQRLLLRVARFKTTTENDTDLYFQVMFWPFVWNLFETAFIIRWFFSQLAKYAHRHSTHRE